MCDVHRLIPCVPSLSAAVPSALAKTLRQEIRKMLTANGSQMSIDTIHTTVRRRIGEKFAEWAGERNV